MNSTGTRLQRQEEPLHHQIGTSFRLERELHSIGIMNAGALSRVGAVAAFHRLQAHHSEKLSAIVSLRIRRGNLGVHWFNFSEEQKAALRAESGLTIGKSFTPNS